MTQAENEWPKGQGDPVFDNDYNSGTGNVILVEAAETIAKGNVVYIHLTSGTAYVSDADSTADVRANGISLSAGDVGEDVTIRVGGVYTTTGLTDKEDYYLSTTAGGISTTRSGVRIGTALSTTSLLINIEQDDRDAIGVVKSYLKSFTGIPSNNMTSFWVECNGSALSDAESPLNGGTIPNLNGSGGTKRFLRGHTTSGGEGGNDTHTHSQATANRQACTASGYYRPTSGTTESGSTLPSYYEVVWIMKVK